MNSGFVKARAVSPRVTVGGVKQNAENALREIRLAAEENVKILVFPELYLSGSTCGDLFFRQTLTDACMQALLSLCAQAKDLHILVCIGLPVRAEGRLYNCAAVFAQGEILGFVPKCTTSFDGERENARPFASGKDLHTQILLENQSIPLASDLLFSLAEDCTVGVEIGADIWMPQPFSSDLVSAGANILLHPTAQPAYVGSEERHRLVCRAQSAKYQCAYISSGIGYGESTTDFVFSGDCFLTECGTDLETGMLFSKSGNRATADLDVEKINAVRIRSTVLSAAHSRQDFTKVHAPSGFAVYTDFEKVTRTFTPYPFLPQDAQALHTRCEEILTMQSLALAKRMEHIGLKKAVVGISGGLDSTLALLVSLRTMQVLDLPAENILCVTMPGFGTTDRTYQNAVRLIKAFGASFLEISIRNAALQHMQDIGHDPEIHDVTYENTQARERTQILMDLANKYAAVLVGTGDLSEAALGFCTYNGDHMSMYGVNAGVPKTLVRHLVDYEANRLTQPAASILRDILDTPVSPELLPPDANGNIRQKTEDTLGPYAVHDFYLYHFVRNGFRSARLLFMAERAFAGQYAPTQLQNWLQVFLRRFFNSQFKRSCTPDAPKIGSVGLSPRGDWEMPSDMVSDLFASF